MHRPSVNRGYDSSIGLASHKTINTFYFAPQNIINISTNERRSDTLASII